MMNVCTAQTLLVQIARKSKLVMRREREKGMVHFYFSSNYRSLCSKILIRSNFNDLGGWIDGKAINDPLQLLYYHFKWVHWHIGKCKLAKTIVHLVLDLERRATEELYSNRNTFLLFNGSLTWLKSHVLWQCPLQNNRCTKGFPPFIYTKHSHTSYYTHAQKQRVFSLCLYFHFL